MEEHTTILAAEKGVLAAGSTVLRPPTPRWLKAAGYPYLYLEQLGGA